MRKSIFTRAVFLAAVIPIAVSSNLIRAADPLDWQRSRLPFSPEVTGNGVTIAHVADLIGSHPDIASNERRKVWFVDPTADRWTNEHFDRVGGEEVVHDLAIAALMAGDGQFRGVAPGANLLLVKGYQSTARAEDHEDPATNDSRGTAALIRWIADRKDDYHVRVITASFLPYDVHFDRMDPWEASALCRAVEYASARGILVVWASGNSRSYSVQAPASAPSILTVGGVTGGWGENPWSVYRHTLGVTPDGRRLPHLLAPCDTPWPLPIARNNEAVRSRVRPAGSPLVGFRCEYGFGSGTSYSSPFVGAVAALCLEVNPQLTPADLRRILLASADPLPGVPAHEQGAGVVNPRRAVDMARTLTPSEPPAPPAPTLPDDQIIGALLDDDPKIRSAGLLALFTAKPRDRAFAESLLPVLRATHTESVCGVLAHLRGWPPLRRAVLNSGLDEHPVVAVQFNWGRIALSENDTPAREAAVRFLKSGDVDLMQLAAHQSLSLNDLRLARPLIEAMTAHPDNLQVQSLGRKALEGITGERFPAPAEVGESSAAVRNRAILMQWRTWLEKSDAK